MQEHTGRNSEDTILKRPRGKGTETLLAGLPKLPSWERSRHPFTYLCDAQSPRSPLPSPLLLDSTTTPFFTAAILFFTKSIQRHLEALVPVYCPNSPLWYFTHLFPSLQFFHPEGAVPQHKATPVCLSAVSKMLVSSQILCNRDHVIIPAHSRKGWKTEESGNGLQE